MTRKKKGIWEVVLKSILDGCDSITKIVEVTGFKRKRVGYAVKLLVRKKMVKQFPNLQDMRQSRYRPIIEELERRKLL